jgi:hypothetical protein
MYMPHEGLRLAYNYCMHTCILTHMLVLDDSEEAQLIHFVTGSICNAKILLPSI